MWRNNIFTCEDCLCGGILIYLPVGLACGACLCGGILTHLPLRLACVAES